MVQCLHPTFITLWLGVRVEWCLAKARLDRWQEEFERTFAEMQCAVRYLEWHENWWLMKIGTRPDAPADIRSGLDAYARRQAAIRRSQALTFVNMWRGVLPLAGLHDPWLRSIYPEQNIASGSVEDVDGEDSLEGNVNGIEDYENDSDEGNDDDYEDGYASDITVDDGLY